MIKSKKHFSKRRKTKTKNKRTLINKTQKLKINKTQKGGNLGTINDPIIPSEPKNNKLTIVIEISKDGNRTINKQEVITVSDYNYQAIFSQVKTILDEKYNAILYQLLNIIGLPFTNQYTSDEMNQELFKHKCILISAVKKLTPEELIISMFNLQQYNLFLLSAKKPVATFNSGGRDFGIYEKSMSDTFYLNWNNYDEFQKASFFNLVQRAINGSYKPLKNMSQNFVDNRIEFGVFTHSSVMNVILYSKKHFELLCTVFEYSIDEGLEILINADNPKEMAFIYIAFGDMTDIKKEKDINNINHAKQDFNPEFMPLFEEYKIQCQSNPELAQPAGWN